LSGRGFRSITVFLLAILYRRNPSLSGRGFRSIHNQKSFHHEKRRNPSLSGRGFRRNSIQ